MSRISEDDDHNDDDSGGDEDDVGRLDVVAFYMLPIFFKLISISLKVKGGFYVLPMVFHSCNTNCPPSLISQLKKKQF